MKITLPTGLSGDKIQNALESIQAKYNRNLRFKRFDFDGYSRDGREHYQVTLTVNLARDKGGTYKNNRHVAAACWHAHGDFLEALPAGTIVRTSPRDRQPIEIGKDNVWVDYNVGSLYRPLHASEACHCEE